MANLDSFDRRAESEDTGRQRQVPEILERLRAKGTSHDFLAGLCTLMAAYGLPSESVPQYLNSIVKREGIPNVPLIDPVEARAPDEFAKMHVSVSATRVLLATILAACVRAATLRGNTEFIAHALEFARKFGITIALAASS